MFTASRRLVFVCLAVVAFSATSLLAATRTWTGAVDGTWTTAGNWSGGVAPVAGDDLVFPATGANQSTDNDYAAGTSFNSLTFSGGAYTLNGNAITLGAGGITTSGGTFHQIDLPLTLGAAQDWNLNTGSSATDLDALNLNGFALTITNSGNVANSIGGGISGAGSITLNGGSGMNLFGVSTSSAPFTVNDTGLFVSSSYPGPITLNTNGDLSVSPGLTVGAITLNGPFAVYTPGDAFPNFGVANSGSLQLTSGASLQFGLTAVGNSAQANVTGSVSLGGGALRLITRSTVFPAGTPFTIINNDGADPIVGTFAGLPEGSTVVSIGLGGPPQAFTVSYIGGTGNDVVLTALGAATATTTTLTSSVNPSTFGQSVTFTATVTPNTGAVTPTGTVTFYDGSTPLATVPLNGSGVATLTTNALTVGSHDIEADYNPTGIFASSFDDLTQDVTAPAGGVPTLDPRALALLAIVLAACGAMVLKT